MNNDFVKMIGYDAEGNAYVLFDVTKDIKDTKEKMPELETGMFIRLEIDHNNATELGFIYNNYIIWQNGGWDEVTSLHAEKHKDNILEDLVELTIYKNDGFIRFPEGDEEEAGYYQPVLWKGKVWYG